MGAGLEGVLNRSGGSDRPHLAWSTHLPIAKGGISCAAYLL